MSNDPGIIQKMNTHNRIHSIAGKEMNLLKRASHKASSPEGSDIFI
jgi:hypothetical protein